MKTESPSGCKKLPVFFFFGCLNKTKKKEEKHKGREGGRGEERKGGREGRRGKVMEGGRKENSRDDLLRKYFSAFHREQR